MERARIDPGASIGAVKLTVSDLERALGFYRDSLGLTMRERHGGVARLFAGDAGPDLLHLEESPGARRAPRTTGLYHLAVLLPSRLDLAVALARLAETGGRLRGASDHGASEAIYLEDPDRNGIEIYRDRPRDEWPRAADGSFLLPTDPLDLEGLLGELRGRSAPGRAGDPAPAGTRIGHVHLHVADLDDARRFYVDTLGFDEMARYGDEALFLSAGGYHHHVGLNVWAGRGAPPPPAGSAGLQWFSVEHSSDAERGATLARVRDAGIAVEPLGSDVLLRDPSRNGVRLTVRG
ncbi:MAG: VOC family protein [Bacteroidota bacterium]